MVAFRSKNGITGHDPTATTISTPGVQEITPAPAVPRRMWIARGVVVLALVPLGAFYLGPRIYDLTATPDRLHQAIEAADGYNPALDRVVEHERVTVAAFAVLDNVRKCVADVLAMSETVSVELDKLVNQISGDLQATLDHTGVDVSNLVSSLDALAARVSGLRAPANGAATALADSRETMAAVLEDVRTTASHVRSTRVSAESAANDLSGK